MVRNMDPLGCRLKDAGGSPHEVSATDTWYTLVGLIYISNVDVLQRSGLSTIGDILRHRRLSLFGHVARLDHGVPTKAESQWPAGEDHRAALSTLCGQFLRQTENTVTVCTRVQWPSDLDTDSSYKGFNLVTCFGHVRLTTWSKKSVYQYQYIESLEHYLRILRSWNYVSVRNLSKKLMYLSILALELLTADGI